MTLQQQKPKQRIWCTKQWPPQISSFRICTSQCTNNKIARHKMRLFFFTCHSRQAAPLDEPFVLKKLKNCCLPPPSSPSVLHVQPQTTHEQWSWGVSQRHSVIEGQPVYKNSSFCPHSQHTRITLFYQAFNPTHIQRKTHFSHEITTA